MPCMSSFSVVAAEEPKRVKLRRSQRLLDPALCCYMCIYRASVLADIRGTHVHHALPHRKRTVGGILRTQEGKIDYTQDFFEKPSYLTVSGQLNAEYYACALSNVYTFGPTFRSAVDDLTLEGTMKDLYTGVLIMAP